jgi:hypothetical protein
VPRQSRARKGRERAEALITVLLCHHNRSCLMLYADGSGESASPADCARRQRRGQKKPAYWFECRRRYYCSRVRAHRAVRWRGLAMDADVLARAEILRFIRRKVCEDEARTAARLRAVIMPIRRPRPRLKYAEPGPARNMRSVCSEQLRSLTSRYQSRRSLKEACDG